MVLAIPRLANNRILLAWERVSCRITAITMTASEIIADGIVIKSQAAASSVIKVPAMITMNIGPMIHATRRPALALRHEVM